MEDWASIQTAHIFWDYKEAKSVIWPTKSLDLNPIKNL